MKSYPYYWFLCIAIIFTSCQENPMLITPEDVTTGIEQTFQGKIDPGNLVNYENQLYPTYINKDNTRGNSITDEGATLGRVLFYDKQLSVDGSISCASCHQQAHAFSDPEQVSQGVNGNTARHSMRLINSRFSREIQFFWDERANSLEEQTTMPIQDHAEMGFSGQNGDPGITDLLNRLSQIEYYKELFILTYGDVEITEQRIQLALSQFIRSIQSFDSKYDFGRAMVNNDNQPFPNFTIIENQGKQLFIAPPQFQGNNGNRIGGGFGCAGCHQGPEFDIDPGSRNNGVIFSATDMDIMDINVTRSPSLRDLFNSQGILNSSLMHTGSFTSIDDVLDHYNEIQPFGNPNLDQRLRIGGGQHLNMTAEERSALIAFLKTLTGQDIYVNEKWADPFPD